MRMMTCFSCRRPEGDFVSCDVLPHSTCSAGDTHVQPVKQPTRASVQALLDDLLSRGILTESIRPWASPIVLIPMKGDGSLRLCIDYGKLNSIAEPDAAYPIPRVDDILDSLSGCSWFTCLDLASGYWQVPKHDDHTAKTAVTTPLGLCDFLIVSGCRNGPATFHRVMEAVLHGLCSVPTQPFCQGFFNSVLNASSTFTGQLQILQSVFGRVRTAGLKVNLEKCSFFQRKVLFLGHEVSAEGLAPDPTRVEAIVKWAVPQSVRGVRCFCSTPGFTAASSVVLLSAPLH